MPRRYTATAAVAAATAADREEVEPVDAGSLLEFERNKAYLLGRAIKRTAQGWQVETPSGTVYTVKATDIKYVLPGGPGASAADLAAVAAAAEAKAQPDLLQTAWAVATDEGQQSGDVFSVPEMADFLFCDGGAASCAAALRLLRDDRLYFKQAGRSPPMFVGRTAAQVESLMGSQRAAEVEAAAWAAFLAEVEAARAAARPHKPGEAVWRAGPHGARLAAVEAFAVEDLRLASAERTLATQTLRGLGQPPSPPDAAELLQSVGWWPPHVQLGLVQAGVSEHFPPELEAAAAALLAAPPPDPDADRRRDFTHDHTVITVDDASTTEIDDGLSLERLPDGNLKVWVHIADPSRWVAPGPALAQEAQGRAKSLYLPTGVVPMFPKCLAEGPFSLRAGVATEAVSVGAQVDPGTGALVAGSVEVVPSRVSPARRLTYVDVDEMLEECSEEQEPDVFALRQLADLRRQWRLGAGATEIVMPESAVSVEGAHLDEPHVVIEEEHQHASPARQLVAEMMILAGEAVGELGRALGVPLPYRGQAEPVLPEQDELAAVPPGPCRAVLLRMRMTRSLTQAHAPVRHAGLGLDAYVQFTSPIRRYGDLLAHWQLKAVLRGEAPPLSADALGAAVDGVGATTQALSKLEREAESYWVAEYFRQAAARHEPPPAWGVMFLCWLKQEVGLGRVLMEDLGLETVVRINQPVQPGERLLVRCSHTDVRSGMWRLDVVPDSQASRHTLMTDSYSSSSEYL